MRAAQRPVYPRLGCAVPGCRRGTTRHRPLQEGHHCLETGGPVLEWLCPVHWRRVPRYLKARRQKLLRAWAKLNPTGRFWDIKAGSPARLRVVRLENAIPALWARLVRIASGEEQPAQGVPLGLGEELRRIGF